MEKKRAIRGATKVELDEFVEGVTRLKSTLVVELNAELAAELEATLRLAATNITLELTKGRDGPTGEDRERMKRVLKLLRQLADQVASIMRANGWDADEE